MFESMWTRRDVVSKSRLEICKSCEHFSERTTSCNQCGCFMIAKTKFLSAECPIGKWSKADES